MNDRLAIRDQGAGVGQIGLSGEQVTYSGIAFGVVTGGDGLNPLIVTFNDEATLPAVQALVRNVTFANTSNAAGTTPRYARYSLTDDTGAASNSPVKLVVMGPSNLNQLPTIATLLADPSPVLQPSTMSLTASGVVDVDGFVQKVSFYVESNNLLGLQTGPGGDLLSGADNDGTNGWSVSFSQLQGKPKQVVLTSLLRSDAEKICNELNKEYKKKNLFVPAWGNIFVREEYKDLKRDIYLNDGKMRTKVISDIVNELDEKILKSSAMYNLLNKFRPDIIIDCINTATAIAYQNLYKSSFDILKITNSDSKDFEKLKVASEKMICSSYIPQLIRHIQILYNSMLKFNTKYYFKVGTSGTGGMGLNIPFTHSEEKPSRVLLSKSSVAGAQTLLLFLMARTPGGALIRC